MSNTDLVLALSLFSFTIIMLVASIISLVIQSRLKPSDIDAPSTPWEYNWVDQPILEEEMVERWYLEPTAPIEIISSLITESSTIHR